MASKCHPHPIRPVDDNSTVYGKPFYAGNVDLGQPKPDTVAPGVKRRGAEEEVEVEGGGGIPAIQAQG